MALTAVQKKVAFLFMQGMPQKEISRRCSIEYRLVSNWVCNQEVKTFSQKLEKEYMDGMHKSLKYLRAAAVKKLAESVRSNKPAVYKWAVEKILTLTDTQTDVDTKSFGSLDMQPYSTKTRSAAIEFLRVSELETESISSDVN